MLTFAHEQLLWLLLLAPALAGLKLRADARGSRAERLLAATRLRSMLVVGRTPVRAWLVHALLLLSLCCLVLALARPRWGEEKLDIPDKGRNVFIAIDTSRSMLARDVAPDRLTRARLAAHDLVRELAGERVGLLAFAGRAYLQAPLTTDHDAIIESLLAFDHTIIEWGGSNLGDLFDVTLRAIKTLPKSNYALVIFSDGGDADQQLTARLDRLAKAGVTIIAVGVGTEGGTLIPSPDNEGDYIRDEDGNVVRSRLESSVMQQIATATGGRYVKLGSQPLSHDVLQPVLDRLTEQHAAGRQTSRPIERFAWPLGLGMLLLMLAWLISTLPRPAARPSVMTAIAIMLLVPPPTAQAATWPLGSLFKRNGPAPEDARKALEENDPRKARELYEKLLGDKGYDTHAREELLYGLAAAEHELTNYDGSVKNFSEVLHTQDTSLRARAHRGLGQSLYDQGARGLQKQPKITLQRWTDALRHLDAALEIDPNNKDLRENRDHVAKMLDQLRTAMKQMEQQQQQQGSKGQKGQKSKQSKGQKGEGGQGDNESEQQAGGEENQPDGQQPPQEKEGKGEKKEADDGIGGKDAKELPEGRIQAAGNDKEGEQEGQRGKEGQKPGGEGGEEKKKDAPNDQRNPRTGYTPGEAEGIIRQYMDEITAPLTNRYHTPPANKKDW